LLIGGGLGALQTASIITGLPFALILIILMFSLLKGLQEEHGIMQSAIKKRERENYQKVIGELIRKREASRHAKQPSGADATPSDNKNEK
jgi:choline/glycine/proline betaine transport protein